MCLATFSRALEKVSIPLFYASIELVVYNYNLSLLLKNTQI